MQAEFKAEAVKLVPEEGLSATQTAKGLGITQSVLSRWVTKAREAARPGALSDQERAELGRRQREVSILQKERAILRERAGGNVGGRLRSSVELANDVQASSCPCERSGPCVPRWLS